MADIICAIRAGEGSRAVQNAAIRAALAQDDGLLFLYVVDQRLVAASDESIRPSTRAELYWMGRTLLRIAVGRAHAAGLRNATWAIREGEVGQEISGAVVEHGARTLFMGASRHSGDRRDGGRPDAAMSLADRLRDTIGVAVDIVSPSLEDA